MWLPPSVEQKIADQRAAYEAEIAGGLELHHKLEEWNRELKELDPDIQLVKAKNEVTAPGLRPGYYHVLRRIPGAPPAILVHEGPNGEFREPDSGLFEELARGDLWNERALSERKRKRIKLAAERERTKERERQDRVDEANRRVRSLDTTQILVP